MLLGCSPVFCFYPHFIKRNLGQETGCHAPVLRTPGDGRKLPPGTGLLNIAGEKIEDSGILGHSYLESKTAFAVFFLLLLNAQERISADKKPPAAMRTAGGEEIIDPSGNSWGLLL